MNLEIHPYVGIGPINFAMSQMQIRNTIGGEVKSFMKTPASEMPTDKFIGKGIHVYYKAPGLCKAVELHPPATPTFRGQNLIGVPFDQLSSYFLREDPSSEIDDSGLTSIVFGLNLFVPNLSEGPQSPVKAVLVFERGYYGK